MAAPRGRWLAAWETPAFSRRSVRQLKQIDRAEANQKLVILRTVIVWSDGLIPFEPIARTSGRRVKFVQDVQFRPAASEKKTADERGLDRVAWPILTDARAFFFAKQRKPISVELRLEPRWQASFLRHRNSANIACRGFDGSTCPVEKTVWMPRLDYIKSRRPS